jgi:inosine-uridine nucleoside N-ribohydrolase
MATPPIPDVGTGTDDVVVRMAAALSPDLELVGATTVNGNTSVVFTTENATDADEPRFVRMLTAVLGPTA